MATSGPPKAPPPFLPFLFALCRKCAPFSWLQPIKNQLKSRGSPRIGLSAHQRCKKTNSAVCNFHKWIVLVSEYAPRAAFAQHDACEFLPRRRCLSILLNLQSALYWRNYAWPRLRYYISSFRFHPVPELICLLLLNTHCRNAWK